MQTAKVYIFLFLLISAVKMNCQSFFNTTWYFGNFAGVEFKNGKAKAVKNSALHAVEGCSVMCDSTGKVMFYTDGDTIWNSKNKIMKNGTGLFGYWSSTQGALITPVPGEPKKFYVFTNDASEMNGQKGLCYSVVDMNGEAGLGEVTIRNQQLYPGTSEKLTAVKHKKGKSFWLIAHTFTGKTFLVWEVIQGGKIKGPLTYERGIDYSASSVAGQLKASQDGSMLAAALYGSYSPALQLFKFNNETGEIGAALDVNFPGSTSYSYGIEFSPSGKKLFCSTSYGHKLFCIDISEWNNSSVNKSIKEIGSSTSTYIWALQLAPDGKIYVAHDHYPAPDPYLGVIENPDAADCVYSDNGFYLEGGGCYLGLPNNFGSGLLFKVETEKNVGGKVKVEETAFIKPKAERDEKRR